MSLAHTNMHDCRVVHPREYRIVCRVLRRAGPGGRHCIFRHGQNATVPCHANKCTSTASTTDASLAADQTIQSESNSAAATIADTNSKSTAALATATTTLMERLRPNIETASVVLYVVLGTAGGFASIALITGMVICCKTSVSSALVFPQINDSHPKISTHVHVGICISECAEV